jgi:hypothetical protein
MHTTIRTSVGGVAALGALALGGAAIAGAADQGTSQSGSPAGRSPTMPAPPPRDALSGDVAAEVKAAALEKAPGATVLRTEAGGPYRTAYHAHVRRPDGTLAVVLVDKGFDAVAVQADRGRGPGGGGPGGGPGRHRGGPGETALTGEAKRKVEAAARAKLPGATIVRTETNADSTAPYESHVRRSDGTEAEVLVSKAFEVVEVRETPTRP